MSVYVAPLLTSQLLSREKDANGMVVDTDVHKALWIDVDMWVREVVSIGGRAVGSESIVYGRARKYCISRGA